MAGCDITTQHVFMPSQKIHRRLTDRTSYSSTNLSRISDRVKAIVEVLEIRNPSNYFHALTSNFDR